MGTKGRTFSKIRRIKKTVRYVVYTLVILGITFLLWRYDLESIPQGYGHLEPQSMPAGTRVVSISCDANTPLGIGSVIRYAPPSGGGAMTYGVIAGLAGDIVSFADKNSSAAAMQVAGRPEEIGLPPGHKIPAGAIPDGYFLVLLGDRHLRSGASHPDSRQLGLISIDWIKAKIISSLYFL
ncbi:MAG: hypothetical protein V3W41_06990 [Planctomycetota bacterium]